MEGLGGRGHVDAADGTVSSDHRRSGGPAPVAVNSRLGTYTNYCNLFDMCAVAIPAGMAGDAQFGVTIYGARLRRRSSVLDVAAGGYCSRSRPLNQRVAALRG